MRESDVRLDHAGLRAGLLERLRGRASHVTCLARVPAIRDAGAILPNPDGARATGFGSADGSLCRRRGAVSVFDYRTVAEAQLTDSLTKCAPGDPAGRCDFGLAVFILGARACDALDTWDRLPADERSRWMCVPHVEACHPGPIPLTHVEELVRVHVTPRPPDPFLDALAAANARRAGPA